MSAKPKVAGAKVAAGNDQISVTAEQLTVEKISRPAVQGVLGDVRWPCPKCGSESKDAAHTRAQHGQRICSKPSCRHGFVMLEPVQIAEDMVHRCDKCGSATKEHHDDKRICSKRDCRKVFD